LDSLGLSSLKDLSFKDLAKIPNFTSLMGKLKHVITRDVDPAHHQDIGEFWTGVFEQLKLDKPTELIECFGTISGPILFRKIRTINSLLQHSVEMDNTKVHTDVAQFEVFMHALSHTHKCMWATRDWEKLTDALDISKDPEVLHKAKYLIYQAKFPILANDFKEIISELDSKNFKKAGLAWGKVFKRVIQEYKDQGEDLLAYQSFGNGLSGTLGTSLPEESIKCYDSESAKLMMDFFRGVTKKVSEGKWHKAHESTSEFWESEGKELLGKIPKKVWACDMKSKDSKEISEKIGIDLGSKEFMAKMWKYLEEHNILFYGYMRTMHKAIEKGDYLHAGATYTHLLKSVAKNE